MGTMKTPPAPPREHAVTCPDCGAPMRLRIATKSGLVGKLFYGCSTYPKCTLTHGAHPDGAPYGLPGNAATRAARVRAHAVFEALWKGDEAIMRRGAAYGWLEEALQLQRGAGHIGAFDEAQCERLMAVVDEQRPLLVLRSKLRAALTMRFGGGKKATPESRAWLGQGLGLGRDAFVRDLDMDECERALAQLETQPIYTPSPLPEPVYEPIYPSRTQEQLGEDMRGLAVLGPWRVIDLNFRAMASLSRYPAIWGPVCLKFGRPDLVDRAAEVHDQLLTMVALATLFLGPDEEDDG